MAMSLTPSYAPPYAAPAVMIGAAPPRPGNLTQGVPNVEQIAQQKAMYVAALEKQTMNAQATVSKEVNIEKQLATFATQKDVAMYHMQVEAQLADQLAQADEQATLKILEVKKAFVERQLSLTAQADGMMAQYQANQLQEQIAAKQQAFQQQAVQADRSLAQQYSNLRQVPQVVPPSAVPINFMQS